MARGGSRERGQVRWGGWAHSRAPVHSPGPCTSLNVLLSCVGTLNFIYLFIWLYQVLIVACGIFHSGSWAPECSEAQ